MDKQEKVEPWRCPYCDLGFPCPCAMDAEAERLDAMAQAYFDVMAQAYFDDTENDMLMTDLPDDVMDGPYAELDELYEGVPKFQKIQRSQTPVSDGHNLQRVTENARNRQLKAARKLKDMVRNPVTDES